LTKELEKEQINNLNCYTELQYKEKRIAELENMGLNEEITVGEYLREMQMLKDRVAELENGNEALSFAVKQGFNDCQAKTLKQFAERLKEKYVEDSKYCAKMYEPFGGIIPKDIDETLKEFLDT
jgi:hypothetical protein